MQNRKYWIYQVAGWGAIAVVFTLSFGSIMPSGYAAIGVIYTWGAFTGILLSHWWRLTLKNRGWLAGIRRVPWIRIGLIILVLGTVQAMLLGLGFWVVRPLGMAKNLDWVPSAIIGWVTIFAVWTALYSYVISIRRARQFEAEALRLEIYAKDAELRALQAQVNPHFFFNSLNSVRALIFENPNAAAQMIDQLAGIMRYALQSNEKTTVTLAREMEAVNAYLAIEKIRFEDRLTASINIEQGLSEILIPPMTVQTLVENAVKYGVEKNRAGSEIHITGTRHAGNINIEVANQGEIDQTGNTQVSTQLGLENARKRLAMITGAKSELTLTSRNGWVRAVITLPDTPNEAI